MEISLIKKGDVFIAASVYDQGKIDKYKNDQGARLQITKQRNVKFHRKFFSLLNHAFDRWEPKPVTIVGMTEQPAKMFEAFRESIIIESGFFDLVVDLNGEVSARAHSISFDKMEPDQFETLYSNAVDVILQKVLTNYTGRELEDVVIEIMGYV